MTNDGFEFFYLITPPPAGPSSHIIVVHACYLDLH
jgi:hypothetical protein